MSPESFALVIFISVGAALVASAFIYSLFRGTGPSGDNSVSVQLVKRIEQLEATVAQLKAENGRLLYENYELKKQLQSRQTNRQPAEPELAHLIDQHFNNEDIAVLAFALGIEPDNLAGETSQRRSYELVYEVVRQNRVADLIEVVQNKRPEVAWPSP